MVCEHEGIIEMWATMCLVNDSHNIAIWTITTTVNIVMIMAVTFMGIIIVCQYNLCRPY